MKNSEVEAILKFYKGIDLDIKIAEEWLEALESGYNPLGAINYDGMPHGINHKSDQTAKLAMKLAEDSTGERVATLKRQIEGLKRLRTQIFKEISSLKPIYKVIICGFYIQGQKWDKVAEQINYSVRHAKNIRCTALKVLGEKLAGNRNISHNETIKELLQ